MIDSSFEALGLGGALLPNLKKLGHETPTPIQAQAIPRVLAGKDVVGLAQTGTGKTAAFVLPILQRLGAPESGRGRAPRALIVTPTRELASQILDHARRYGARTGLVATCIHGGVSHRPQTKALRDGTDLVIATPGRLLDLAEQGDLKLGAVEVLVLDEADQMLDIGFAPAIRRIVRLVPKVRQTLLFSATMPPEIATLAKEVLHAPERIAVTPPSTTADRVGQSVMPVAKVDKPAALAALLHSRPAGRTIVFARTKHGSDKVVRKLAKASIKAAAIHGNKSQGQRDRALDGFRSGDVPVLIATDIAARGIDVPGVELVVNYDLPNVPEVYVHRIGRTARAGATGEAVAFCDGEERPLLRAIEKLIGEKVPHAPLPEGFTATVEPAETAAPKPPTRRGTGGDQPPRRPNPASRRRRARRRKTEGVAG